MVSIKLSAPDTTRSLCKQSPVSHKHCVFPKYIRRRGKTSWIPRQTPGPIVRLALKPLVWQIPDGWSRRNSHRNKGQTKLRHFLIFERHSFSKTSYKHGLFTRSHCNIGVAFNSLERWEDNQVHLSLVNNAFVNMLQVLYRLQRMYLQLLQWKQNAAC